MDKFRKVWVCYLKISKLSEAINIGVPFLLSNPTPLEDAATELKWERVDPCEPKTKSIDLKCLDIDKTPKMVLNPDKERINFWRAIYSRWNEGFLKPKL